MADDNSILNFFGLGQPDPNAFQTQTTPGLHELILRLASTLAPASHFIGGTRTPLGRALGATSLIAGTGAGSIADMLQAQRSDPLMNQLRLAQQIQQAGTAPTTTNLAPPNLAAPPDASAMTYSPVAPGQPSGFPGPRQGAAKFDVNNLPAGLSMVAQKMFPSIDPTQALKDEELKARTAYLQRTANAPLAVPTGTELRDQTGTTVIAPARQTEAQQILEHNNNLYRSYATDVAVYQQAHPGMDRLQAADAVLNDPNKGYGELPETYGLVKSAKEWRTEQFKNKTEMEKQRFSEQQQNAREAFSQSENNRRFERELSTRDAPGLYADKTTGEIRKVTRGELASDMNSKDKNFKSVLPTEAATVDLLKNATPMIDRMEELVPKVLAKNKGKQLGTVMQNYAAHKMGYDPDLQELMQLGTALSAEQARALGGSSRVLGSMFSAIRGESVPGIGVTAETAKRQLMTGRKEINNRINSITGRPLEKLGPDKQPTLPKAPPTDAERAAAKRLGIPLD